jgi:hypothetical protein
MNDFYRSKPTVVRAKIFDPDKMDEMKVFVDGDIQPISSDDTQVLYVIESSGRNTPLVKPGQVIVIDIGIIRVYDIETFHKLYDKI